MLEEVKRLREQAKELNNKARKLEKEYFNNKSEQIVEKYYFDNNDTYYKVEKLDTLSNDFTCFSLYWADDNTMVSEWDRKSLEQLQRMKEITKEEAEKVFNQLVEQQRRKFIG